MSESVSSQILEFFRKIETSKPYLRVRRKSIDVILQRFESLFCPIKDWPFAVQRIAKLIKALNKILTTSYN